MTSFGAGNPSNSRRRVTLAQLSQCKVRCIRIGSLLPAEGQNPSFLQLYFIDNSEREVQSRLSVFASAHSRINFRQHILHELQEMFHNINPIIVQFQKINQSTEVPQDTATVLYGDKKLLLVNTEEDIMLHQLLMRSD
jgi:hypothetical protein